MARNSAWLEESSESEDQADGAKRLQSRGISVLFGSIFGYRVITTIGALEVASIYSRTGSEIQSTGLPNVCYAGIEASELFDSAAHKSHTALRWDCILLFVTTVMAIIYY